QQDVSFDAILNQLASSLRLEVVRVDDLLLLQKPDVRLERQVSYPVADLAKGTAAIAELVQLIDALALDEKTDAVTSNDGTQIVVNRPTEQQYEVLLFLERLRKSRGLPTRSKYPAELVSAEPVLQALKKRLSQPTTFAV